MITLIALGLVWILLEVLPLVLIALLEALLGKK